MIALQTLAASRRDDGSIDNTNTPVAILNQMADCFIRTTNVIDQHRINSLALQTTVNSDNRNVVFMEKIEALLAFSGWHYDCSRDPLRAEDIDILPLFGRVLIRITQDNAVAIALGNVLNATNKRGKKRILNIAN